MRTMAPWILAGLALGAVVLTIVGAPTARAVREILHQTRPGVWWW